MILNLKVKTIFSFKGSNHNLYSLAHCYLSIIIVIVAVVFFFSYIKVIP